MNSKNQVPAWVNGYKAKSANRHALQQELLEILLYGETGLSTESQTDD